MYTKNIGVLVDAENLRNPSLLIPIIRSAHRSGRLCGLILFGNWASPVLASWKSGEITSQLEKWGAVWSPVPKTRPGKNAADIALTFEAALMAKERHVTEIWLVSGDSDFTPMLERLKAIGISVMVFGPKTATKGLRAASTSFVLLDDLECGIHATAKPNRAERGFPTRRVNATAKQIISSLVPDSRGWFHGFVRSVGKNFGFIQINTVDSLFFGAHYVDPPMAIQDLHSGDPVEFKIGKNYRGFTACHVRRTFAFRAAQPF
jgi:cold shock CspA family protein